MCYHHCHNSVKRKGAKNTWLQRTIFTYLELGGKSANIFFEDCDWEMAMDGLQMGILFNQGQVCCAGSRVFVQESIYDRFVKEAVKRFNKVKVGLPWETETQMGCQILQCDS